MPSWHQSHSQKTESRTRDLEPRMRSPSIRLCVGGGSRARMMFLQLGPGAGFGGSQPPGLQVKCRLEAQTRTGVKQSKRRRRDEALERPILLHGNVDCSTCQDQDGAESDGGTRGVSQALGSGEGEMTATGRDEQAFRGEFGESTRDEVGWSEVQRMNESQFLLYGEKENCVEERSALVSLLQSADWLPDGGTMWHSLQELRHYNEAFQRSVRRRIASGQLVGKTGRECIRCCEGYTCPEGAVCHLEANTGFCEQGRGQHIARCTEEMEDDEEAGKEAEDEKEYWGSEEKGEEERKEEDRGDDAQSHVVGKSMKVHGAAVARRTDEGLESLPDELVIDVCMFLKCRAILRVSAVSRSLRSTVATSPLWRVLYAMHSPNSIPASLSSPNVPLSVWRELYHALFVVAVGSAKKGRAGGWSVVQSFVCPVEGCGAKLCEPGAVEAHVAAHYSTAGNGVAGCVHCTCRSPCQAEISWVDDWAAAYEWDVSEAEDALAKARASKGWHKHLPEVNLLAGCSVGKLRGAEKKLKQWRSVVQVAGTKVILGTFQCKEHAALVYDVAKRLLHPPCASLSKLNYPSWAPPDRARKAVYKLISAKLACHGLEKHTAGSRFRV